MNELPRRKRFPRLMLIATLLIIILISAIAWNFHTPANDPQVQAIRQQGYPVTLRELDVWYGKVPDEQNLALVYTNVFAQIALASNAFNKIKEDSWVPKRGQAIAAEDKAEIAAILATNRETLEPLFLATN